MINAVYRFRQIGAWLMKTTDFSTYTEHQLTWEEDVEALSYIEIMKDMLVNHGFDQKAVDGLRFDVRAYTLKLTEDEKKAGAWHRYDGNVPFFEVSVSTAATLDDLSISHGRFDARTLPVESQSAYLLVDIASNCFAKIEKLSSQFGSAAANDNLVTDKGFNLDIRDGLATHIATRRPLDEFFGAAADLLVMHLKGSQQKPPMPSVVGGGAPRL